MLAAKFKQKQGRVSEASCEKMYYSKIEKDL